MTTNRMGLEQTLSYERLELFISKPLDNGLTRGEQMELARELRTRRKAAGEPVAWESTTTCYVKYVTDKRYQGFSDQVKQWYKPYKCSNCAAPPLQAVTVPDGWKLVPIDPTENMVIAGFESKPDESFSEPEEWEAYEAMSGCQQAAHKAKLCWAAMLAAVPKLQAERAAMLSGDSESKK